MNADELFQDALYKMIKRLKENESKINNRPQLANHSLAAADITSVNKAKILVNFILSDGTKC